MAGPVAVWQIHIAMEFDVDVRDRGSHMRVTITGEPMLEQLLSLVHVFGLESAAWPHAVALVDLRAAAVQFAHDEQVRIGEEAALSLSHLDQLALLVAPQPLTRVAENAARRSGVNVRVFDDEQQALAWLRVGPAGG